MRKLLCIVALFIACADPRVEQAPPDQLKIAYRSTVTTLDPIAENTVISDSIYSNIYEPLVSTDASGAFDFLIHTRDDKRGYGIHNVGGYSNSEVDRMIEYSSEIMKPSERAALLTKIMERVMADLPLIPLHVENSISASSANVHWTSRPDEFIYCKDIQMN